jgi:hypothetical protein
MPTVGEKIISCNSFEDMVREYIRFFPLLKDIKPWLKEYYKLNKPIITSLNKMKRDEVKEYIKKSNDMNLIIFLTKQDKSKWI